MLTHDARGEVANSAPRREVLASAAFGPVPGLHPLPAAHGPEQHWLRAVALGGQGRYAAARAELAHLRKPGGPHLWASLGASTEASFLRQLGGHRAAAILDGRALSASVRGEPASEPSVQAWCDAVTGLAADALGRGRLGVCGALLDRCASVLDATESEAGGQSFLRQRIRIAWVGAESALAAGDFARARPRADRAVELSREFGSVRHSVKSDLVRAASLTGQPDRGPATALAADVLARAGEYGLIPLQWAAAMLLDGLDPGRGADVRDLCETSIVHRGGRFAETSPR
ncbi:hypothetical protein [Rhodococcus sp. CH91]|uniref:hypothetical protein n=1 Tax=Rhodococcus sp. CH91 TaxID=2910256 RepID=UPI001F4A55A4|nr:hypothetical protein [Rhodococcus sp. CH91]